MSSAKEIREKDVRPVWNKLPENYSAREARYMKKKRREPKDDDNCK